MKNTQTYLLVIALAIGFFVSCKNVEPPQPYGAIATEHQLKWQELEYYMFIHFGPNTFTDVEWGDGKEDPKVFNPTNVDCRQWAATAKAAGMKGIIITAKHHDGFCLWPSNYSTHTVRESLWKDGKGDILKELSEACKEYGLKFGVYLSPWDQNHPAYGTPEYNQIFANTLNEVLTGYGEVFEQWFDGANGGAGHPGKEQIYDWDMFHDVVYKNQPQAIIFSDVGPGCRWMGNERGVAGETNWSTMDIEGFEPGAKAPSTDILNMGQPNGKAWVPAETDVSIRPGWFYSPSTDDKVKTVEQLMDIYYTSVGRNSNLLLNVPPDRTGRIHPNDSIRLMEFRKAIEESFGQNLIEGVSVDATNVRGGSSSYAAANVTDGKSDTYWAADDGVLSASLTLDFKKDITFNRIMLQEYIALGQRVSEFNVEYWDQEKNDWVVLTKATTIGYKRILRFPTVTTTKVRVNITNALACPVLSNIEIYKAPEQLTAPFIKRDKDGLVTIQCVNNDPVIYYTLDGTEPTLSSPKYNGGFPLPDGGIVKAIAVVDNGNKKSEVVVLSYDIAPIGWVVLSPSGAEKAIDGDTQTYAAIDKNQSLVIDMKKAHLLKGFSYTPVGRTEAANISRYNFYISEDGKTWTKVVNNAIFNNVKNNPIKQDVILDKPLKAGYIKIEPTELTNKGDKYLVAEIGLITR
ncbi:alpha-L-fucosidase [Dysgonomonas sp. ZJ709]|uniref:alpha-L-fucosidase n=1 Tax=Dysgonomonas sp. ZJ709 TaxID=2709797 RepID=UPI0013EAD83F|nr:alpha-L-fucosidase [Dysgonomonas sp. ZJ709]